MAPEVSANISSPLVPSSMFIFPQFAAFGSLTLLPLSYHFSKNVVFFADDVMQAVVLSKPLLLVTFFVEVSFI